MRGGKCMARKNLRPVSIAGIEFDALIEEQKTMSATIPSYPIEDGFPVSDTIILEPISIQMTLYVTNTPVTWLQRHGSSMDRVNRICEEIENLWLEKKLVKIVTSDTIYTNMGITSISIKKSKDIGYAREIQLQAQKVPTTKTQTTTIPSYLLKSGTSNAEAGMASTLKESSKSSNSSTGSSSSSSNSQSNAKKSQSILYGVATGLDFL